VSADHDIVMTRQEIYIYTEGMIRWFLLFSTSDTIVVIMYVLNGSFLT